MKTAVISDEGGKKTLHPFHAVVGAVVVAAKGCCVVPDYFNAVGASVKVA